MKKNILSAIAVCAALFSCQKKEFVEIMPAYDELHAMTEVASGTRTVMDEFNNVLWSADDQIVAFMRTSLGLKYQLKDSYIGKTSGAFSKVASGSSDDLVSGMELDHIVAYYPYSESVMCSNASGGYALNVVLPSEQTYAPDSFGNGAFPMVAVSSDNNIAFRNVCGGIKFLLKGTQKVRSIKIQGRNDEKLSGAATVTAYADSTRPTISMAPEASPSVTLHCGSDGVQLNESTATEFILALPPTIFSEGFTVTITDTDTKVQTLESDKENTVIRSSLLVMPEVTVETVTVNQTPIDLSASGTANSYIVSSSGFYQFTPTKGNSSESVGAIASVSALWETFGTDVAPVSGDLITDVRYENGVVLFRTSATYKEGNAVIAAKDSEGTILWSWHIWLTDQPQEQVYFNNAGTMMDRNLGATSATPGDVGALGLLYQWGRKDPFLGSSSINEKIEAKSTITWPSTESSNTSNGTIEYATSHPTTFITYNSSNNDWCYTGSSSTDNTRWTTSETSKSIYDPCPSGWRVPDGGSNGVWSKALGSSSFFIDESLYDSTNGGMNFAGRFGGDKTIWYPAEGNRTHFEGTLANVGNCCICWSASPDSSNVNVMHYFVPVVYPSNSGCRAGGASVRCVQDLGAQPLPDEPKEGDYVDEYGVNHGQGVEIDGVVWAPVNCGYHETDYKYGKLYQWGRKYGQGYDGDCLVTTIAEGPVSVSDGQHVDNSEIFYISERTTDWCYQTDDLWNKGTYSAVSKTEYDPCPSGWRVPGYTEICDLIKHKSSWCVNENTEGCFFSGSQEYDQATSYIFLPASGLRGYESGEAYGRGQTGAYWSVEPEYSKYGGAYGVSFNDTKAIASCFNRAEGVSVRCVQE